ncbi:ABC-type polysaccharide/polyol phosphate export systems permease component-like protein [Shewanella sediminis HAW-EB3]|uniref:Transport permease protein n=2 Tax=Shewanella sediminis TaxID=271097 RepID=A8FXP6_SHESH|nr:ABC-type polysaccharide/polyol phosphate export systems permease component-like protein [Shewanella sediminis HAW-EB3]
MHFFQYCSLIHVMARMKLKSKANMLLLSYVWWVLEPLLFVLMFYFVFKFLLNRGREDFFIFLIIGKIPFLWFSKSVTSAANSLIENRGLINQRPIPKFVFPLVNVHEAAYQQLVTFAVLISFVIFNGYHDFGLWWQLIPLIFLQYLLICGLSSLFTLFVTYAPDFRMIVSMFMMGMMFCSGIFWSIGDIADPQLQKIILLFNPLAVIIDGYRQVLMHGQLLNWMTFAPALLISLGLILTGFGGLKKFDSLLTRRVFM